MSKSSESGKDPRTADASTDPGDRGWIARWSRRKHEARRSPPRDPATPADDAAAHPPPTAEPARPLPAVEELSPEDDYSGFLSPEVDDAVRRLALRKLFHSAKFNLVDGLDDYAEDYRSFEALGDVMTADLRHRLEIEAERERARLAEADDSVAGPGGRTQIPAARAEERRAAVRDDDEGDTEDDDGERTANT